MAKFDSSALEFDTVYETLPENILSHATHTGRDNDSYIEKDLLAFGTRLVNEGQLDPILAYRDPEGLLRVVVGNRRHRGIMQYNFEHDTRHKVRFIIQHLSPAQIFRKQIAENHDRLNENAVDIAQNLKIGLSEGFTREELCTLYHNPKTNKPATRVWFDQMMAINDFPAKDRAAIRNDSLAAYTALFLNQFSPEDRAKIEARMAEKAVTAKTATKGKVTVKNIKEAAEEVGATRQNARNPDEAGFKMTLPRLRNYLNEASDTEAYPDARITAVAMFFAKVLDGGYKTPSGFVRKLEGLLDSMNAKEPSDK